MDPEASLLFTHFLLVILSLALLLYMERSLRNWRKERANYIKLAATLEKPFNGAHKPPQQGSVPIHHEGFHEGYHE